MNTTLRGARAPTAVVVGSILAIALASASASGCTSDTIHVGDESKDAAPPPFSPVDASDSGVEGGGATLSCIGTECPPGFGTCLSGYVGTAPYKCGTDLARDNDNCGACGNKCLVYPPLHMTSRCIDGSCEMECYPPAGIPGDWRNCNIKVDDGCETNVLLDVNNCGGCGNACGAGVPCIDGKCGCGPGEIACDGKCVDPMADDQHCGRCGNSCYLAEIPGRCIPAPANSYYGCQQGSCAHLKCFGTSGDCNNDIPTAKCASDGCEVQNLRTDLDNCGGCGVKCAPGEACLEETGGNHYCGIPCAKEKKTRCGFDCNDLLNDVRACGTCGHVCALAGPNQTRACQKGLCVYECVEGFADCNEDPTDGCEVNLRAHPENCGTCGHQCDLDAEQPCVDGVCLTVDCNTPGAR